MNLEIFGAGFGNFGAQLMLAIAVRELRARDPNVRLSIDCNATDTFTRRARLGLEAVFPTVDSEIRLKGSLTRRAMILEPLKSKLDRLGIHTSGTLDGFIDISGYRLGDKWGSAPARALHRRVSRYKTQGKPIVFLPQMFGPFENREVRKYAYSTLQLADRIYARDLTSRGWLEELNLNGPHVEVAPDITIAMQIDPLPLRERAYACIVPNERMLDRGGKQWQREYIDRLQTACERIENAGLDVVLLLHSRDTGDRRIAERLLKNKHPERYSLCDIDDPIRLKQAIAASRFLVGSRFHAIVASLSSSVPVIAIGWAHKYPELLKDFGVSKFEHKAQDSPAELQAQISELLDEEANQRLRLVITDHLRHLMATSSSVWDQTAYTLQGRLLST